MTVITKLTREQEEYLPVFRQKYLDIACGGGRIDRDKLQDGINMAYKLINKNPPQLIILQSPLQAMIAVNLMENLASADDKEDRTKDMIARWLLDPTKHQIEEEIEASMSKDVIYTVTRSSDNNNKSLLEIGSTVKCTEPTQAYAQLADQLRGQLRDQLRGQLGDRLWDQLRDQLWGQLKEQLKGQLWGQLRDQMQSGGQAHRQLRDQMHLQLFSKMYEQLREQLWGQLRVQPWDQLRVQPWVQLRDHLRDHLRNQLWEQLRDRLWEQLRDRLWEQLGNKNMIFRGNFLNGSQDLYWIAWARFAQHVGVKLYEELNKRLDIAEAISTQCEWWWPYNGICFASERPTVTRWDGDVLHCETGPAVEYEDGFKVYSWRGTNVPGEWIETDALTPEIALNVENVEQRRAACEILGWHNVLEHPSLNPKIIDEDLPHIGTLIQVDLPDAPEQWFIKYQCGTGRWFAEAVNDKTYNTALKANAGGNGWRPGAGDPENFIPFIRT